MKWLNFFLILLLLNACQKESIQLDIQEIDINTTDDIYDINFIDDKLAYACGGELWKHGFIARSVDGGMSWEIVFEYHTIIFSVDFKDQNNGVAGTMFGGVLVSTDGGDSWEVQEYPENSSLLDVQFLNDSTVFMCNGSSYHFGGYGLYNFKTRVLNFVDLNKSLNKAFFFNENEGVLASYGAVYSTQNQGKSLDARNAQGDYFVDICFNENNEGLAIGYQGNIWTSKNKGANWEKTGKKAHFFSTKGNLEGAAVFENKGFICGQNGSFFYAENFLDDWITIDHPFKSQDLKSISLKNGSEGFVTGSNGLLFKFNY
jgi:photosystem II stability/assembly factor-like uncharacterized protein